jgi:hypothetical protein
MEIPDWPRPRYRRGGGDAQLHYMLFGDAPEEFAIDGKTYRCKGIPAGMALDEYDRERQPAPFEVLNDPHLLKAVQVEQEGLLSAARNSNQCILLHGTVTDPPTLNYLRDAVGLVQFLLDNGSVAALDLQTLTWHSPESWREAIFGHAKPSPREHTVVLCSEDLESEGRLWYHTRGMRKFGRPDISVRAVPVNLRERAEELCNRLIEHQAFGEIVADGQEIELADLPEGIFCLHAGDVEDPDFNNDHLHIQFPA